MNILVRYCWIKKFGGFGSLAYASGSQTFQVHGSLNELKTCGLVVTIQLTLL